MKKFISFFMLLLLLSYPVKVFADIPAAPIVDSESVIMINGHTGEKILAKKSDNKINTDSLIPLLTTLVALDHKNPDEYIIVTDTIEDSKKVTSSNSMKLYSGEKFLVRDLIALILLSSDDNAINSLAMGISGSTEEFSRLCNEKAMDLKMANTKITAVLRKNSGNDYTTVNDLTLAMREFSKNPELMKILATKSLTFNPTNISPQVRTLDNSNLSLYTQAEDYYEKSKGGIISESLNGKNNSYISLAEDGDSRFIIALSQSKKVNDSYKNSKVLFDWAFNNFITKKIINKGTKLQEWPLKNGEILDLVASEDFYQTVKATDAPLLDGEHTISYKPIETEGNKFYKGQLMGVAEIIVNNNSIGEIPLLSSRDIEIIPPDENLAPSEFDFIKLWLIRIGLTLLLLTLIILIIRTYNKMKRSKVKQARIKKRRKEYLEDKRKEKKEA